MIGHGGDTSQAPARRSHQAKDGYLDSTSKEAIRQRVWAGLRHVARPDSRFHWNFAEFIADYEGSEVCAERIQSLSAWRTSDLMFITPDNNLEVLRRRAMEDGKRFVMSTYGIARGSSISTPRMSLLTVMGGLRHLMAWIALPGQWGWRISPHSENSICC